MRKTVYIIIFSLLYGNISLAFSHQSIESDSLLFKKYKRMKNVGIVLLEFGLCTGVASIVLKQQAEQDVRDAGPGSYFPGLGHGIASLITLITGVTLTTTGSIFYAHGKSGMKKSNKLILSTENNILHITYEF